MLKKGYSESYSASQIRAKHSSPSGQALSTRERQPSPELYLCDPLETDVHARVRRFSFLSSDLCPTPTVTYRRRHISLVADEGFVSSGTLTPLCLGGTKPALFVVEARSAEPPSITVSRRRDLAHILLANFHTLLPLGDHK